MRNTVFYFLLILNLVIYLSGCTNNEINNDLETNRVKSIFCWGDSKTEGWHTDDTFSYPDILHNLICNWGGHYNIYNLGARGENSQEILQRQGALPLIVRSFIMPSSSLDSVKFNINSRLRVPEAGCNPCYINGIKGRIIKDKTDKTHHTFYFSRENDGESFVVSDSSKVITDAMLNRKNDILIIDIGYNGGYKDIDDLINQIWMMIDYNESKKYVILGRVDNQKNYSDIDEAFNMAFGKNFINLREFYINQGLQINGLEANEVDKENIAEGIAPCSLFYDKAHENYFGYYCKAMCVFNKLVELNYIVKG